MTHTLQNVKSSRDEKAWEFEVRAEIPAETLEKYRTETLKEMQKTAKLDGFRQGHAPLERLIEIYGEGAILKQAAERAVQSELPELLAGEQALIIEAPQVMIEALEKDKPVKFSARAPLAPRVELPDYISIAKKHPGAKEEELTVTDKEHADALLHFRRERARISRIETGVSPEKAQEEAHAIDATDLPELDETFVKSLGMESLEKFHDAVRANMKNEKEIRAREKRRAETLDDLIASAKISYPTKLLEYELDDMEARLKADLERMGTNLEGYLTQAKKTREQLRGEWKEVADKRAKVRLVLTEIARKETIEPDAERLTRELENAKKHVPNADPKALEAHIAHALRNEAVLEFLEKQS